MFLSQLQLSTPIRDFIIVFHLLMGNNFSAFPEYFLLFIPSEMKGVDKWKNQREVVSGYQQQNTPHCIVGMKIAQ